VLSFVRVLMLGIAAAMVAGCATGPSAPAGPPKEITVNVFPGGFNWPIWAAQETGLFARHGVKPNLVLTPNSQAQLTGLITGKFDIAMTAIDNLVAYKEAQGAAPMIGHDLLAVMGGDQGFLRLAVQPEIKNYNDLRGKTLSVDALTTGYAFVLYELLDRNGLKAGDYKIEPAGGVLQRFAAMTEKKHSGTLLISPFEVQAAASGLSVLANASEGLGKYQGLVAGVRGAWAERNRDALVGYIRGYVQGLEWLYDPANRAQALAIFQKNVQNSTPQQAETSYKVLLESKDGFQRRGQIDLEGVRTVLNVRSKWSAEKKQLTNVDKYYDPQYYNAALNGLR
jgi:ABC-type nitrate/sulfonate/bicarbonate transport system substrate-binding protein